MTRAGTHPRPGSTTRIAHRGAPTIALENTLRSLAIAEAQGADAIELDVRATRDGVPVLLHDRTLERFWGDPRPIDEVDLADVRKLGARSPDGATERVPTFEEALDGTRVMLVVDIKTAAALPAIHRSIERRGQYDRIVFNGEPPMADAVRRAIPHARIVMSWSKPELPPDELLARVAPFGINLKWSDENAALVPRLGAKGYDVWAWTIDDAEDARRARNAGMAAIISNDLRAIASGLDAAR